MDLDLLNRLWVMPALDMPIKVIAQRLGVTVGEIIRLEREHDLPQRPKSPWNKGQVSFDTALLFRLWHSDPHEISTKEIARRLCVSISTLHKWAGRHKLPKRERVYDQNEYLPTPEEIAEKAREIRERHLRALREEPEDVTRSRLCKQGERWHQASSQSRA
jgi:DNA-binding transcriptional regulator YiaG